MAYELKGAILIPETQRAAFYDIPLILTNTKILVQFDSPTTPSNWSYLGKLSRMQFIQSESTYIQTVSLLLHSPNSIKWSGVDGDGYTLRFFPPRWIKEGILGISEFV